MKEKFQLFLVLLCIIKTEKKRFSRWVGVGREPQPSSSCQESGFFTPFWFALIQNWNDCPVKTQRWGAFIQSVFYPLLDWGEDWEGVVVASSEKEKFTWE